MSLTSVGELAAAIDYAAALTPRSWRFTDAISRLRKRHCRPFLKAGIMLRRANSFTVSGLKSRRKATSRELSKTSSLSAIFQSKRRLSGLKLGRDLSIPLRLPKSSFYPSNVGKREKKPRLTNLMDRVLLLSNPCLLGRIAERHSLDANCLPLAALFCGASSYTGLPELAEVPSLHADRV